VKRFGIFLLLLAFALTAPLQATEIQPEGTSARKLHRGFLNVALSPMEISTEIAGEGKEGKIEPTWLLGGLKGIGLAVRRVGVGLYEILTFPIPSYEPIVRPEFPWQHFDDVPKKTS
jgi:putative exosortase-associated protein (TIGR04073 family)